MKMIFILVILLIFFLICFKIYYINAENNELELKKWSSVTIVGTAKNVEEYLENTISKIEILTTIFNKHNIIIYENDSIDNTLNIFKTWENNSNLNIKIISEKNIQGLRTHVLSYARNKLLDEAIILDNEYLIVLDLDDRIQDLKIESVIESLTNYEDKNWSVLGSNTKDVYYDIWALRTFDDWMPFDWVECVNKYKKGYDYCLYSRVRHIQPQNELIQVKSCFGGFAIYKTKYLKNCKYYGGDGEKEVCEHVSLNHCIINKNNGRIFINTNMITS